MLENHEVLVVTFGVLAEGDVAVVADDEREDAEERERFISEAKRKRHRGRGSKSGGTRDQFHDRRLIGARSLSLSRSPRR